jgi:hypothetical protein
MSTQPTAQRLLTTSRFHTDSVSAYLAQPPVQQHFMPVTQQLAGWRKLRMLQAQ